MANPTFTRATYTADLGNGQERRDWILGAGHCAMQVTLIGKARITGQPRMGRADLRLALLGPRVRGRQAARL
ncbi:MAG TPA: hypothetical protein VM347_07395 [Nonomuraea sp.]|nr:hypothetical protein [Nonomuraea sp.]